MLQFKPQPHFPFYLTLAHRLLRNPEWQPILTAPSSCWLRHRPSRRVYELVHVSRMGMCESIEQLDQENVHVDNQNCIFMHLFKVSQEYFLSERAAFSLNMKIGHRLSRRDTHQKQFSEEEIANTFLPILQAIQKNKIPKSYCINQQNIQVDLFQNIRLRHPSLSSFSNLQQTDHRFQLAILILQILLKGEQSSIKEQLQTQPYDKTIQNLLQNQYSYSMIGFIIILLDPQKYPFPFQLKDLDTFKIGKESAKNIKYLDRHSKCEDETQDFESRNRTIVKYRGGRRVYQNQMKGRKDGEIEKQTQIQMSYEKQAQAQMQIQKVMKPRKYRLKPSYCR